ncbi:hypothetical protein G5I_10182 [Acromyrmex echinatior]|uniref:Uncharacterized protein n=1 Tax=Acromyrmex echinatior TaxID=103372 RepID=F4WW28_ACREC|nr:hypothetical protein G5I_10182 [Acromyrmex echinatior]
MVHNDNTGKSFCWVLIQMLAKVAVCNICCISARYCGRKYNFVYKCEQASQHTGDLNKTTEINMKAFVRFKKKRPNVRLPRKCGVDRIFCQALPRANPSRNERRTNNANVVVPPTVPAVLKKEPQENIARIAKRYLDDNMQQAWINPRLISMKRERLNQPSRARSVEYQTDLMLH